jgi:hypothetical protein
MITSKLGEFDVMLLIDIFPTPAVFIQKDKYGDAKFPIVSCSAFIWASRQYFANSGDDLYWAVSRIKYSACVLSERQ